MDDFELGGNRISCAFVSGIWGDLEVERRKKVLCDVQNAAKAKHQPYPRFAYCYGADNYEAVRAAGFPACLLDESPVVDFHGTGNRNPDERGVRNYGVLMWRHKLEIIHRALQQFEAVIWLDWDSRQLAPLPNDLWERLAQGAPIQASLVQYRRRQCHWRNVDQRKVPSAAWIYMNQLKLATQLLELYDQFPLLREEQIICRCVEQELGGWQGVDGYIENGYEPFCFRVRTQIRPPEVPLFDAR